MRWNKVFCWCCCCCCCWWCRRGNLKGPKVCQFIQTITGSCQTSPFNLANKSIVVSKNNSGFKHVEMIYGAPFVNLLFISLLVVFFVICSFIYDNFITKLAIFKHNKFSSSMPRLCCRARDLEFWEAVGRVPFDQRKFRKFEPVIFVEWKAPSVIDVWDWEINMWDWKITLSVACRTSGLRTEQTKISCEIIITNREWKTAMWYINYWRWKVAVLE